MKTKVIRYHGSNPSPFLVAQTSKLQNIVECNRASPPLAIDIGCGNGRNSEFLKKLGFNVMPYDMHPDYGHEINLEHQHPPHLREASVILLQYVLMFLSGQARKNLFWQCLTTDRRSAMIVVELMDVKHGNLHGKELISVLDFMEDQGELNNFIACRTSRRLLLIKSSQV